METLKAMNTRKSVRSYTGALSDEALQTVLKAGQAAPIGRGKYDTMHMTVIRDKSLLEEIDRAGAAFFGDMKLTPPLRRSLPGTGFHRYRRPGCR